MSAPTRVSSAASSGALVLAAALHAAGRGWPVFPVRGKAPAIRAAHPEGHPCRGECGRDGHGFHDAGTDPDRIRRWFMRLPGGRTGRLGYAISTGPAGLVVIDLDTGKAPTPAAVLPGQGAHQPTPAGILDGADVLTWAAERDGAEVGWGQTLTVATPSGGTHLYYAAPALPGGERVGSSVGSIRDRITGLGWCIDVRAGGGYVVGPGSPGYSAVVKGAVAALPAWLAARIAAVGHEPDQSARAPHNGASVGSGPGQGPCMAGESGASVGPAAGVTDQRGRRGRERAAAYGRTALQREAAAVAATGEGGRNSAVNRAAFKLGRLIEATGLDPEQVAAALLAAATAAGLPEREARTAIASGLATGQARPRVPQLAAGTASAGTASTGAGDRRSA